MMKKLFLDGHACLVKTGLGTLTDATDRTWSEGADRVMRSVRGGGVKRKLVAQEVPR